MAEIRNVNPTEMSAQASKLSEKVGEWSAAVTSIYTLQSELDAMWDGNANDSFNLQWQDDRTKYNTLGAVMEEYVNAITNAANLYTTREAEANAIIKS